MNVLLGFLMLHAFEVDMKNLKTSSIAKMEFNVVCEFDQNNNIATITTPSQVQANPTEYSVALVSCNLLFSKSTGFKVIPVLVNGIERTTYISGRWEPAVALLSLSLTRGRLTEEFDAPQYHRLLSGNDLEIKVLPHVASGNVVLRFSKCLH